MDDDDLYHCSYGQSLMGYCKQIYKSLMSYNWELSIFNIYKKFITFISIQKVDKFYMKQIENTIIYEKISHVGIFELLSFFYF
jgi:hypothetical protein